MAVKFAVVTIPFVGLIYRSLKSKKSAIEELTHLFKASYISSSEFDFDLTDYYEPEMGSGLKRCWCSYETTIRSERIVELKLITMEIEKSLATNEKRSVNIDPGLIQLSRVSLATHKDAAHRVYLGQGVYIEVTLIYQNHSFNSLPWTYPDYKCRETIQYFNSIRENLQRISNV